MVSHRAPTLRQFIYNHFIARNSATMKATCHLLKKQEQVTHHIAAEGDVVFLDHTETWTFSSGETAAHTFASMHEVKDGLVYRWSDYWDMQKFVSQFPGWFLEEMMKSTAADFTD